MDEDYVFVDTLASQHNGYWLYVNGTSDVVVSCNAYDLGMPTRQEVYRQLTVDLPRSRVVALPPFSLSPHPSSSSSSAHNHHTTMDVSSLVDYVLRRTVHPRMCTQAVLAPPLEWIMPHGYMAHEISQNTSHETSQNTFHPTTIQLGSDGTIEVTKRLGLRPWSSDFEKDPTPRILDIHIKAFSKAVVVGLTSSDATNYRDGSIDQPPPPL